MPAATEQRLPAAMIARRQQLEKDAQARVAAGNALPGDLPPGQDPPAPEPEPTPAPAPAPAPTPTPEPAPAPAPTTVVPAADDELRTLRERLEAMEQRNRLLELQALEAAIPAPSLLTAPQGGSNAEPTPAAPSGPVAFSAAFDAAQSQDLTEQERTDYAEAESAISKMATKAVLAVIRGPMEDLAARLATLEGNVKQTTEGVQRVANQTFMDTVKSNVKDFDVLVNKPEWITFMESEVPYSGGLKFKDALSKAHNARQLPKIVEIFDKFRGGAAEPVNTSGYNSAPVTSGVTTAPAAQVTEEKLPFSARKKASDDYLKGRITREELDKISKQYNEAGEKGLIDYNK